MVAARKVVWGTAGQLIFNQVDEASQVLQRPGRFVSGSGGSEAAPAPADRDRRASRQSQSSDRK